MRHRNAIRAAARAIMAERSKAAIASQLACRYIQSGFYAKGEVRMAMQPPRRELEPEDGYLYAYFHALIVSGAVSGTAWRLGSYPYTAYWNQMLLDQLQRLPTPLHCTVVQNRRGPSETGDGVVEWAQPVTVGTSHINGTTGTRERVRTVIPPGQAPLEIGHTDVATTIWHLHNAGALVRWPENSAEVCLFVRSEKAGPNLRVGTRPTLIGGATPEDFDIWGYYEQALARKKGEQQEALSGRV